MSIDIWLTYLLATTLVLIVPGPTIILVISQAVRHGRKSVIPLTAGVVCGDLTAMSLSLLGLGAIMVASATLFTLFKWAGAVYLFYLGINLWREKPTTEPLQHSLTQTSPAALFRSSFIVTALNPKGIAFFVAFLPQFVRANEPVTLQLLTLGGTFLGLALLNAAMYGFFASRLRELIHRKKVKQWLNRCSGTALIGAGLITSGMQRST
ncbi:MAG: LysE family translocator [Desulfocapsaceae bacterium]|nr:LysE family translocator [Desulfocapsaceae bacterium]